MFEPPSLVAASDVVRWTMRTGIVKWFDVKRGFGFILDGEWGLDIFVHFKVIEGEGFRKLYEGEPVEYEAAAGPNGRYAVLVRRIGRLVAAGAQAGLVRA
jgi:cold shock protein